MSTATATPPAEAKTANGKPRPGPVTPPPAPAAVAAFSQIATKGVPAHFPPSEVHVFKKLQTRDDTDSGSTVDEERCKGFGAAMEKGAKFPPIKVMKVMDAPGHKNEETVVCWDGMHTLRGAEIAKKGSIDALVWVGTWAQAQYLAATRANREHEANGKPLSSRDKIHAVKILSAAWKDSGLPKRDWPSNRDAAVIVGCSRQLVNDMDPFDRGGGDKREIKAAKKRGERAGEAPVELNAKAHYDIVEKATGQVVAAYDGESEAGALETHKGHRPDADLRKYVARKQAKAPGVRIDADRPGSEKPTGFDWAGMDHHLGYIARGMDGMGDVFGLKGENEYRVAVASLNSFASFFNQARKKYSKKASA